MFGNRHLYHDGCKSDMKNKKNKVREFLANEWAVYKELRLRSLDDSPDAFGKTLAEEQRISDAKWSSRLLTGIQSNRDLPLIAEVNEQPVGLAWGKIEESKPDTANLYQMWVAPNHRSKGTGSLLLKTIITWAETKGVTYLELGVTLRDSPALNLYKRFGFLPIGEPQEFRSGSDLLGQKMCLKIEKDTT